jgi:hypothetical protein
MKIKSEFVTNSSSVSFVVVGIYLSESDISENLKNLIESKSSVAVIYEDFEGNIDTLILGTDLDYSFGDCNSGSENVMVGMHYTDMKDNETLGEFKARVQKQLKDSFGIDKDVGHIESCWKDS